MSIFLATEVSIATISQNTTKHLIYTGQHLRDLVKELNYNGLVTRSTETGQNTSAILSENRTLIPVCIVVVDKPDPQAWYNMLGEVRS